MNRIRWTVAVQLALFGLLVSPSYAQVNPSSTPITHVPLDIPVKAPNGWDPKVWQGLRDRCQSLADKSAAHLPETEVEFRFAATCRSMGPRSFINSAPSSAPPPAPVAPSALPTPNATIEPQTSLAAPLLASGSSIGPYGTPITAASQNACSTLAQPPDVAADVSPTQIVELNNSSGLWISDKAGNVAAGYPESLGTFWAPNSPGGNFLFDTQVAYEPVSQRWLATTLSTPNTNDNGDLYFAFSQTSDATKAWNIFKIPSICKNSQNGAYPLPDQPNLGYGPTLVVIDVLCFKSGGESGNGSDQVILIPHSLLTEANPSLTYMTVTPTDFASRPTRDVSGQVYGILAARGGPDSFLVSSVVPTDSNLPALHISILDSNGVYGFDTLTSPGNGVLGTYNPIALAQHDSCGANSACAADIGDSRIVTSPILQKGNDGNVYLLTSYHAGDRNNSTAQALWFEHQFPLVNNPDVGGLWNLFFVDGPTWWSGYPTITMDQALNSVFTFQTFALNSNIYPNWYLNKGFVPTNGGAPPLVGDGILANPYRGAYAGCSGSQTRWGDYMSTSWDPNLPSPAAPNGFWTAQEYSSGGSNQTTQITELANSLPYFVGYSANEAEAPGNGQVETLNLSTPTGLKNGDVVFAFLDMGGNYPVPPSPPDSTWVELPIANEDDVSQQSGSCANKDIATSYAYAHVYGSSSETGSYKFKKTIYTVCGVYLPEIEGIALAYRQADNTLSDYLLYGYLSSNGYQVTVGPAPSTSPSMGVLLNVFYGGGVENESSEYPTLFSNFTGTPAPTLLLENSVPSDIYINSAYFAEDVGISTGGVALGQYSATSSLEGDWWGWQLFIPPGP